MILSCPHQAAERLMSGDVVALPTETVYGLAAHGHNAIAMEKIYQCKGRPKNNPLILHYANLRSMRPDVVWTDCAEALAQAFWPGALTLVLERSKTCRVPSIASAGNTTLAVRVPSHALFQDVLRLIQGPLAAPSANLSGQLSPTRCEHVKQWFDGPILNGGTCHHGLESTIVDARTSHARILRQGAISQEQIEALLGGCGFSVEVVSSSVLRQEDQALVMPGQMEGHYAPRKPLRLNATELYAGEGLMAFGPSPLMDDAVHVQLSQTRDLQEAAQNLFHGLYLLDHNPECKKIAVMPLPQEGLGRGMMDRLTRAALGAGRP